MGYPYNLIKEILVICALGLYLFSRIKNVDLVYWGLFYGLIISILVYPWIHNLGLLPWATKLTVFQYQAFIVIVAAIAWYRTGQISYSFTLAYFLALASGYFYEVPRFLLLNGLPGLFEMNRYSPLAIDLQIWAMFFIPMLFMDRGLEISRRAWISLGIYLGYAWAYYFHLDLILDLKFYWSNHLAAVYFPAITVFRAPIMIFFILLVDGLRPQDLT